MTDDAAKLREARRVIILLLDHLPDRTGHSDEGWDEAWEALSDDAQYHVKRTRKMALRFLAGPRTEAARRML